MYLACSANSVDIKEIKRKEWKNQYESQTWRRGGVGGS